MNHQFDAQCCHAALPDRVQCAFSEIRNRRMAKNEGQLAEATRSLPRIKSTTHPQTEDKSETAIARFFSCRQNGDSFHAREFKQLCCTRLTLFSPSPPYLGYGLPQLVTF